MTTQLIHTVSVLSKHTAVSLSYLRNKKGLYYNQDLSHTFYVPFKLVQEHVQPSFTCGVTNATEINTYPIPFS